MYKWMMIKYEITKKLNALKILNNKGKKITFSSPLLLALFFFFYFVVEKFEKCKQMGPLTNKKFDDDDDDE